MTAPIPERHPDRSTRTEEPMKFNGEAVEQVGRLFKENAELRTELARVKAELGARIAAESADAAAGSYAGRTEKAEAALAEMRERLGEPVVQWAVMLDDTESSPLPEKVARRMASDPFRTTLLTRDTYPNTAWRSADATPRTALERAADEPACTCRPNGGMKYHALNCAGFPGQERAADEQGDGEGGGDA